MTTTIAPREVRLFFVPGVFLLFRRHSFNLTLPSRASRRIERGEQTHQSPERHHHGQQNPAHPRDSPTTVPSDGTRTPKYRFDRGKGVSRWPAFLSTSWEFDEDLAMARGAMAPLLAAPWRLMLLSDGSVTRHLQLLTDAKVIVDVLSHDAVRLEDVARDPTVPPDVAKILAADIPFPERSGEDPDFSGTTGSIDE